MGSFLNHKPISVSQSQSLSDGSVAVGFSNRSKPGFINGLVKFIATIPMGRLSEPQDIANACLYLASDEAEFITGAVFEVDGGRTI